MTILYVNGDSYSAETKIFKSYSKVLSEKLDTPVINDAAIGSSNDRIFRTTLEYISSLKHNEKPFVVIGFSFVTREEVWIDNFYDYKHRIKDFPDSQFVSVDWLQKNDVTEDVKNLIIDQNINSQMIHFYTKLYMLSGLLKSLHIPYLMFSAARNTDFRNLNWGSLKKLSLYRCVTDDENIMDFETFNIPLWAAQQGIKTEETGHLLEDGHKQFADFLYNKIKHQL